MGTYMEITAKSEGVIRDYRETNIYDSIKMFIEDLFFECSQFIVTTFNQV